MDPQEKTKLALAALSNHAEEYGISVPERIFEFWRGGEALQYDRKCLPAGRGVPGFEDGSMRLALTVPNWIAQTADALDDAVVGPNGDWEHAKEAVPLFSVDGRFFVAAKLTDPECPVGWFEEETWGQDGNGHDHGIFLFSKSLTSFLGSLVELTEATYETEDEIADLIWEDE